MNQRLNYVDLLQHTVMVLSRRPELESKQTAALTYTMSCFLGAFLILDALMCTFGE